MISFKNWIKFLIEPIFSLNGCGGSVEDEVVEEVEPQETVETEGIALFGGATTEDITIDEYHYLPKNENLIISEGHTLTINSGKFLRIFGTIENKSTIKNNGILNNKGTITNNGALIDNTGSTLNNDGTITNNESIVIYGTIENKSTIKNNGILNNKGTITNNGALIDNTGSTLNNDGTITNNESIVIYGTLSNTTDSTLNNNNNGEVCFSGTINNEGSIINNNGIFYKSIFSGSFTGKPASVNLTNGLFGTLTTYYKIKSDISVPKNTELYISTNGEISERRITDEINYSITNNGLITNYGYITNRSSTINNGTIDNKHRIENYKKFKNYGIINCDFESDEVDNRDPSIMCHVRDEEDSTRDHPSFENFGTINIKNNSFIEIENGYDDFYNQENGKINCESSNSLFGSINAVNVFIHNHGIITNIKNSFRIGKIHNYGTINNNIKGDFEGEINIYDGYWIHNYGIINNSATLNIIGTIESYSNSTINNTGKITIGKKGISKVNLYGYLNIKSGGKIINGTSDHSGEIDNRIGIWTINNKNMETKIYEDNPPGKTYQ